MLKAIKKVKKLKEFKIKNLIIFIKKKKTNNKNLSNHKKRENI